MRGESEDDKKKWEGWGFEQRRVADTGGGLVEVTVHLPRPPPTNPRLYMCNYCFL